MTYLLINPNYKPILYAVIVFVIYCVFMFTDFDEVCKRLWEKCNKKEQKEKQKHYTSTTKIYRQTQSFDRCSYRGNCLTDCTYRSECPYYSY